jgi:dihydroorotate dehydrogenase
MKQPLELVAAAEPALTRIGMHLPPRLAVRMFSEGRTWFAKQFASQHVRRHTMVQTPVEVAGVRFGGVLYNAAGMFKRGEAYHVVANQGAAAYVAGTTTAMARNGNVRDGIRWPAVTLPNAGVAINWMGLPNEGHAVVARRLQNIQRIGNCPVGASVSIEPGDARAVALAQLVEGIEQYRAAGVDFLEINESCPNVPSHIHHGATTLLDDSLLQRLEAISTNCIVGGLGSARRRMPMFVKFSTDTSQHQLPELLDALATLGFAGCILGNTSINYNAAAPYVAKYSENEQQIFQYFTSTFGGGVSGKPLTDLSMSLCRTAAEHCARWHPDFAIIRCGGIFDPADLAESHRAGVCLNQWYTGYFSAFRRHGHAAYEHMYC